MRAFWIALILLVGFAGNAQVVYIKNTTTKPVFIRNVNQYMKGSFPIVLRAGKDYSFSFSTASPTFINLSFGRGRQTDFLITAPDSLSLSEDTVLQIPKPLSKYKRANDYFNITIALTQAAGWLSDADYLRGMPDDSRKDNFLKDKYLARINALNTYTAKNKIPEWVDTYFRKLFWGRWLTSVVDIKSREEEILKNVLFYKNELRSVVDSFNCSSCIEIFEYKKTAYYVFMQYFLQEKIRNLNTVFQVADKYFKEKNINQFLKAKAVYDSLQLNPLNNYVFDRSFLNDLSAEYGSPIQDLLKLSVNSGKHLDSVYVTDEKGNTFSFKDIINQYAGNTVVVDCWASWCAPCKKELPNSLKYEKELKDKKVRFVFLSIDNDILNWKKALPGVQLSNKANSYLLLGKSSAFFSEKYHIDAIPRYLVFDARGNIVSYKFDTPGSAKFREKILQVSNAATKP